MSLLTLKLKDFRSFESLTRKSLLFVLKPVHVGEFASFYTSPMWKTHALSTKCKTNNFPLQKKVEILCIGSSPHAVSIRHQHKTPVSLPLVLNDVLIPKQVKLVLIHPCIARN